MLTTNQKGLIAETAILPAAARAGIDVAPPRSDMRYDLIVDLAGRFVRVQCKWGVLCGDVVSVRCYSSRRGPLGKIKSPYTAAEVDALAAYCAAVDRCFYIPLDVIQRTGAVSLRLRPPRNNQRTGVNWANDFDFERVDWAALRGP